jgi:2-polyprenyl-6-hydroxyphenyl methylase/3-demethylubiquinone-9 3-methyltransferase
MKDYYAQKLSAERLRQVYEIAPPRIQQYLDSEIEFVLSKTKPTDRVLELGCGYGRVIKRLLSRAKAVIGIDTSLESLQLAQAFLDHSTSMKLFAMNAIQLGFRDQQFDVVVCIQNGISAFQVDQRKLIQEAIRVARPGGIVLFSSYSEQFWDERLHWFRLQADYRLVGEIDEEKTRNGVIVCEDGFRATTLGASNFFHLTSSLGVESTITEVDGSSLFCEIQNESNLQKKIASKFENLIDD